MAHKVGWTRGVYAGEAGQIDKYTILSILPDIVPVPGSGFCCWIVWLEESCTLFKRTPCHQLEASYVNSSVVSGIPLPPTIKNEETEIRSCNVNVSWSTPLDNGCPLTNYSVYYREMYSHETEPLWREIKVTDVLKTHYFLSLKCDTRYMIEVSAWNEKGESDISRTWITKTMSGKCSLSSICFMVSSWERVKMNF